MVKTILIVALLVSAIGAPAPILHYSNTRGFAMFTDVPFLLGLLLQSVVAGGVMFFAVVIGGVVALAIGRALRWMLA